MLARRHAAEVQIMKQMLHEKGVQLPKHLTDANLIRFAVAVGGLRVRVCTQHCRVWASQAHCAKCRSL